MTARHLLSNFPAPSCRPMRVRRLLPLLLLLGLARLAAQPTPLSVNPASREEVRQFYRAVYFASENVPMEWTGSYTTGNPGGTSPAFNEATRLRINFYRALAGVPAAIAFDPAYNSKNQRAALMMSANDALDHFPPATWRLFTPEGEEAARKSNLAIGIAGPAAIDGYIADIGRENAMVGHRRWLFYPQTLRMGTGDVPGDQTHRAANTVWVQQEPPGAPGSFGSPRPPTRTTEIAYPPAGFVPHSLVWPRWSIAYPDADFSAASVTMSRDGQPVAVTLEPLSTASTGEPTLVWVYDNQGSNSDAPHVRPAADTSYLVNVNNVRIAGAARTFTYSVTVFDPDVPGADATLVSVSGSTAPAIGAATVYAVARPGYASGFDWRIVHLAPSNKTYTAAAGLDGLVATTTPGYMVVEASPAGPVYRLSHMPARSDQILAIPGTYLATSSSAVTFRSRLAVATSIETARVQVSTDDGATWGDVFRQMGASASDTDFPVATEIAFVPRQVSLAAFAGRTIAVRLVHSIALSGTAFLPAPGNEVGWFIDQLTLANVQRVTASEPTRIAAGNTFTFHPTTAGPLTLQARGLIAGAYPLEWGALFPVTAIAGEGQAGTSHLSNLSVRTTAGAADNTLIVGFTVSGGTKPLLVRGIGPSLAAFGVAGALVDPRLELYGRTGKLSENDDWSSADGASFLGVGAFDLPPGSRDAVLVASLASDSYTAQVSGSGGGTGITLVELYDTERTPGTARLSNVSARSRVGIGDDVLVAGFTIGGEGFRSLLIRAVGPTLTAFGVSGVLADPLLEVYDSRAAQIATNDNWTDAVVATAHRVGAFQLTRNSRDAALVVDLPPGSYTAQIKGVGDTTGIALVEVYEVH